MRKVADWLSLERRWLTGVFWTIVATYVASFWVCRFPPCIDYPQHLALGAAMGRMLDPDAPEHELLRFNLLTYNGGFHVLVALLSRLMPVEAAGKLLLSAIPVAHALAGIGLMRWFERPTWFALFLLPFSYSHVVGWGFVNYALAAPTALGALVLWLHYQDGARRFGVAAAALGMGVAYTHVFATLCLTVCAVLAFLFSSATPRRLGFVSYLKRAALAALPLVPAVGYTLVVYSFHAVDPNARWDGSHDGEDYTAWSKLSSFARYAVGNFSDGSDERIFTGLLLVLGALWVAPYFVRGVSPLRHARSRQGTLLALAWFVVLLLTPKTLMSTAHVFERVPFWTVAFAVAAAPAPGVTLERSIRRASAVFAALLALLTLRTFSRLPGQDAAGAILEEIPEGARVFAITRGKEAPPYVSRSIWVHFAAYHVVRRRGELAFSFTRYGSLPLRYRTDREPPEVPAGIEWHGRYRPDAEYARYFDHVLVRTSDEEPDDDPTDGVFGAEAEHVRLVARHGRFWLFDASGLAAAETDPP
jgi:hypothetical protein